MMRPIAPPIELLRAGLALPTGSESSPAANQDADLGTAHHAHSVHYDPTTVYYGNGFPAALFDFFENSSESD